MKRITALILAAVLTATVSTSVSAAYVGADNLGNVFFEVNGSIYKEGASAALDPQYGSTLVVLDGYVFTGKRVTTDGGKTFKGLKLDGKPLEADAEDFLPLFKVQKRFIGIYGVDDSIKGTYGSYDGVNWAKLSSSVVDEDRSVAFKDKLIVGLSDPYGEYALISGDRFDVIGVSKQHRGFGLDTYPDFVLAQGCDYSENGEQSFYTYYVSNDGLNYRVLKADGKELKKVTAGVYELFNNAETRFNKLDNALAGNKPITREDFEKLNVDYLNLRAFKASSDWSEARVTINGKNDLYFTSGYNSTHYGIIKETFNEDGSSSEQWLAGGLSAADMASDGKGRLLITGRGGAMKVVDIAEADEEKANFSTADKHYSVSAKNFVFNPGGKGIKMTKFVNGRFILGTYDGLLFDGGGKGESWSGLLALPSAPNDIAYYKGGYYIACDDGIYKSDLKVCKKVFAVDDSDMYGNKYVKTLCVGKDKLIAGGIGVYYSTDGSNWTAADMPQKLARDLTPYHKNIDYRIYGVAYGNGVYVAGGGGGSGNSYGGYEFISKDGKTWEEITQEDLSYGTAAVVEFLDGKFIAPGLDRRKDGVVMTSYDGKSWDVEPIYRWGLDAAEPLPGVVVYINEYSMRFESGSYLDFDGGDNVTDFNGFNVPTKLAPKNPPKPLFVASEEYDPSEKR